MLNLVSQDIYFKDDDEFYNFCVIPNLVVRKMEDPDVYYSDFDFSDAYKNAINSDRNFVIMDENSKIFKHGAVSVGPITKKVQNLKEYKKYTYGYRD